ncbi:MAG: DNA mismatch repair endonuclease MutL [Candidatus Woesearchaeota archaeon]
MGKIIQLPVEVINKIAAGEIIERPSNVVKELVENSIDAEASEITVEVEKAGKKRIVVTDNGCGMSREDAILAVEKHTTSKIRTIEDIYKILSYGFRGEALASIASVSKFQLITSDGNESTKIIIENNIKKVSSDVFNKGTKIIVEDLFFNIPVRRKYLKSDNIELKHIIETITNYALVYPEISFKLIADNKVIINASKTNNLKDKVVLLLGLNYAKNSLEISYEENKIKVHGLIGNKNLVKKSKTDLYIFVNKRPVRSDVIEKAIKEAYGSYLSKEEFPFVVINIEIPPEAIDPNVHPKKETIIFFEPEKVFSAVFSAIKLKLIEKDENKFYYYEKSQKIEEKNSTLNNFEQPKQDQFTELRKIIESLKAEKKISEEPKVQHLNEQKDEKINNIIKWPELLQLYYLGQFSNTYLIFTSSDEIWIFDQHLVEERYNYEKLKREPIKVQQLLEPIILNINKKEFYSLLESKEMLKEVGFEIEEIKDYFAIRSVPDLLKHLDSSEKEKTVKEIIEEFLELKRVSTIEILQDELLKTIACKSSVKAGQMLNPYSVKTMITNLAKCEQPYTCPHGRPVVIKISKRELDKMFQRI